MQNALEQPAARRVFQNSGTAPLELADADVAPRMGFSFVLLFLFVTFARIPELIATQLGVVLPIAMVLSILAGVAAILATSLPRLAKMRAVIWLIVFTVWLGVAAVFSSWRGGTFDMFKEYWSKSILICLVIAMLIRTLGDVRKIMETLAYATLVIILTAAIFSGTVVGRLVVGDAGSLSNPNELASRLSMGLCFCLFVLSNERGFSIKRAVIAAAIPVALLLALRTGSRAGLLTLVVLFIMLVARVSIGKKLLLFGGGTILALACFVLLPKDVTERYAMMFTTPQDAVGTALTEEQKMAVGSRAARTALMEEGIGLALTHPLVGVGPGVYAAAAATEANAGGHRAMWHETHNTYVQLAAEDGIPGLLLYALAIGSCLASSYSIYRKARKDPALSQISEMSYFLLMALVSWAVGAFFDSEAYRLEFPVLAALICVFSLAAKLRIDQYLAGLRAGPVPAGAAAIPVPANPPAGVAPRTPNRYRLGRMRTR
jgi:O-antigen ligase